MPIAKEDLYDGSVLVAKKGTYVSPSTVEANNWSDKVDDDKAPKKAGQANVDDPQRRPER